MKQRWKNLFSAIALLTTIGALDFTASWAGSARVDPPLPVVLNAPFKTYTPSPLPTVPLNQTLPALGTIAPASGPRLEAFIEGPTGPVPQPYVILSATQTGSDQSNLEITGLVNSTSFTCPGTPCRVILQAGDFNLDFKAVSALGYTSPDVFATIQVDSTPQGFLVDIKSTNKISVAVDACRQIWGPTDNSIPSWAQFPQFAHQLNTQKTLQYLVTMLTLHGLVDVKDCQGGGVTSNNGWPTGCGLERARGTMIAWQNQFDDNIWQAAYEIGIPPKILKTLIEIESQFWPGNQRFYLQEYGLGQINQLGLDPLLRSDNNIYQSLCLIVYSSNCLMPYFREPVAVQAMLRGTLMQVFDATCPTCTSGLDLTKAGQSIPMIARVLLADCSQVKNVVQFQGVNTSYEDYWRFTLLSYHSGVGCFQQAVKGIINDGKTVDWHHLTQYLDCAPDGERYVDGFWADLNSFDSYRYIPVIPTGTMYVPIPTATRTPEPISKAKVVVVAFIDLNGDGLPQPSELLSGIHVDVTLQDGRVMSGTTSLGLVTFDMTGVPAYTVITVSLPGLYRSYSATLPLQGTVPVLFMFKNPALPQQLP